MNRYNKFRVISPVFGLFFLVLIFFIMTIICYIKIRDSVFLMMTVVEILFLLCSLCGNYKYILDLWTGDVEVFVGDVMFEKEAGGSAGCTVKSLACKQQGKTVKFIYFPGRVPLCISKHISKDDKTRKSTRKHSSKSAKARKLPDDVRVTEFVYLKRSKAIIELRQIGGWGKIPESESFLLKPLILLYLFYMVAFLIYFVYFQRDSLINYAIKNPLFCYPLLIPILLMEGAGAYSCVKGDMNDHIWHMEGFFISVSASIGIAWIILYLQFAA